ncbi:hypothetical protein [Rhizobium sp. C1]|uniref:hypothetical protein n=1 Tax=Rhizobium sp. C1 TaxID=1349799 RepID=UPI001E5FB5A9|nr:hypothetical protein [Rhizobium sp. C1]MCD2176427.1 hypothetical protein [Rhizobium sp. C1]
MPLATIAAALFTTAVVAQTNEQKLLSALWIEWGLAHCDVSIIPASTAMFANMIIGGTEKSTVEAARLQVSEGIKAAHRDDIAGACAELANALKS